MTFGDTVWRAVLSEKGGRKYLGAGRRRKCSALKTEGECGVGTEHTKPWPEVRDQLNRLLGWSDYFSGRSQQQRRFTKWTGRCEAKCSYGFGASISVLGERLGEGGITMSFMNDVGCIGWSGR